jgi:hypothetical protein
MMLTGCRCCPRDRARAGRERHRLSYAPLFCHAIEAAAPSFGMTVTLAPVHDDAGTEQAIGALARTPGGGLIVLPKSLSVTHRDVIIAAATRHRLPLMGATGLFPRAGA